MNTTRPYTMTTRARAVEETRARIIDACVALHGERPVTDIGLDDIAVLAEVSVQTLLHFGSRAGLVEASFERARFAVVDPADLRAPANAELHRFVPHGS